MKKELLLSCVILAALACGGGGEKPTTQPSAPTPAPLPAWATFQGNARHSGYVPLASDASKFVKNWDVAVKPGVALNPVVEDGNQVYVSTSGYFGVQMLFGVNHTNGATLWSRDFGPIHGVHPPACANGKVYVTTSVNQYDQWTPAVDGGLVYAYTGNNSPALTVFDSTTGATAYSIPDPGFHWDGWSMNLAPVVSGETLFAIQGNRLLCFDLANKKIAWQLTGTYVGQVSLAKDALYMVQNGELEARHAYFHRAPLGGKSEGIDASPLCIGSIHLFESHMIGTLLV